MRARLVRRPSGSQKLCGALPSEAEGRGMRSCNAGSLIRIEPHLYRHQDVDLASTRSAVGRSSALGGAERVVHGEKSGLTQTRREIDPQEVPEIRPCLRECPDGPDGGAKAAPSLIRWLADRRQHVAGLGVQRGITRTFRRLSGFSKLEDIAVGSRAAVAQTRAPRSWRPRQRLVVFLQEASKPRAAQR